MSNQQIYDTVVRHLFTQKVRAVDPIDRKCLYRAPNGCSCAVGCLIPDELYTPRMERKDIDTLRRARREDIKAVCAFLGLKVSLRVELLLQLQTVHDHDLKHGVHAIRDPLRRVAERFGLSTAVLDEMEAKDV